MILSAGRLVSVLLMCARVLTTGGQTSQVHLTYTELGTQLFAYSDTLKGCYADLDSYPHWCLGNLSRCHDGITVTAWIRLHDGFPLTDEPDVILASGGYNVNTDGFFITKRYSDQITVGVAFQDKLWQTTFRLTTGSWVMLSLAWDRSEGLQVLVDGVMQEEVKDATIRAFNPSYDYSQARLLVGVTEIGAQITSPCSINISKVEVLNSRNTSFDEITMKNLTESLRQGCMRANAQTDVDIENIVGSNAAMSCRLLCGRKRKLFSMVKNEVSCACVNDVNFGDLWLIDCTDKWRVYAVSHIQTKNNYQISLDYTPQSKNLYTKPGEDMLFNGAIDYNLDNVYRFEFDDGVVVLTTQPPVSHSWAVPGKHNVTVSTEIGIVPLAGVIEVTVEDVDEGKAPTFLGTAVSHDRMDITAQVLVMVVDAYVTSCTVSFGDGFESSGYVFNNSGENYTVAHEYRVCGFYRIHTKCVNKYGNTTADLGFWAREMESGYHYISNQESFNISVLGDHIFFRSLSVKVNDITVDFDLDVAAVKIRRSSFIAGVDNVICLISDGVLIDRHVVSVRVRVDKPLILADKTKGAWNASVRLTFTLQPSDHIWMIIGFGNGWPKKVVYVPETEKQLSVSDLASYVGLGVYTVNVRVFNEISEAINTLEISVEVPISSLAVTTSNITSLQEDAIFVINLNNKRQGPQKVDFRIDYGDGNVQDIKYKNNLTNGFEPLTVKHKYTTWGIYRVKVTASNNISQMVDNDLIHVGENITFVDIRTTKERVYLGGSIDFTIDCPTGTDVRYTVDFGDGTNFTVGELTGPEYSYHSNASVIGESRVIVSHIYASSGYYSVRVIAGNTFGSMTASLCPTISVMEVVSTDCQEPVVLFKNTNTSLTSPLVRKRSVETVVIVDAISGCPQDSVNTDLTYSWKGISLVSRGKDNVTEQSIYTFCTFKATNNTLVIPALSLPFGLYTLSVTVSPDSNDLVYTRKDLYIKIVQSEPIPAIDGEEVRTIMLYATAIFDISKTYDPDITDNQRQGISFHLFFMPEVVLTEAKKLSLAALKNRSSLVASKVIFPTSTVNPFFMYQYGTCFNGTEGLLDDLSTFAGKITFAAANFVTDYFSFGVILWAERNNLSSMTTQIIEVRESDMKLADLGSLLNLAMNADPDTAIRLCGGAASAILTQDASSAEVQEKLAESTEAVVKTLGSVASRIDSPNQAAKCASAIKTMTSNKDIVSEGSRSSAVNAFVSLANGTSSMSEATVDDTANFAGECLGGLSNIFPSSLEDSKSTNTNEKLQTTTTTTTTTELLGLVTSRMASSSSSPRQTTVFSTRSSTSKPTSTTVRSTTTSRPTTSTPTTVTTPAVTTTTVVTTSSWTSYHTIVGASLSPTVKASFEDNGSNYTISGITVGTLQLNASKDDKYPVEYTTTTTMATTTATPETTPVTIPINPRMLEPRNDVRTAIEIGKEIIGRLPQQETYKELMDYIFHDCFLFRKVMKTPEIQSNCPSLSSEAINLMKCDEGFSLQDRVFDIMTQREHPDDLYQVYLIPLSQAKKERDKARKETDKMVATSGQEALQTVADCVGARTAEEDKTERSFATSRLAMKLGKVGVNNATNGAESANESQTMQISMGSFDMPSSVLNGAAGKCSNVNTMFMGDSNNPFTYSDKGSNVGNGVLSLSYSCNGEKVKVESSQDPILLWIERNADAYEHDLFVLLTNTKREVWSNFNYHPVNLTDRNSSLQVVIEPQDYLSTYDVYVKYGDRPNMTHYDFKGSTPNDEAVRIPGYKTLNLTQQEQLRYTITVPIELTHENGTYWVGVKFKSGNMEIGASTVNTSYTLLILVSGCRYWDEDNNTWSSEGCRVGPLTTKYKTQCFCNHLTSFGADAVVAPNTIDFTNVWAKFNRLGENAAVFSTVVTLLGIYVILLVWLRHMDKRDLIKWGALPLEDNLPTDSYHYLVTVQTGIKKGSGTDSGIRFIVSGEDGDSGVRQLMDVDNKRKHLPRGSILNYMMSVDACLGPLSFLRIWHDNSGKGKNKSWYLDNVQINDLQTGEKFIFLCDRWLAVEMDDGMVDRTLPVAGIEDLIAFKQLFTSSARKKLSNDHLWISLFSRPARSNFTRVQRVSCCMSLLFLTMITNAMWFKQDTADEGQVEVIRVGPFSFTLAQFFISVASTVIVFPPNFLMITFFRRCRPKGNVTAQINQPEGKDKQKFRWKNVTSTSLVWAPRAKKSRLRKMKESIHKIITFHKRNLYVDKVSDNDVFEQEANVSRPKTKQPWSLPFWCIYIAWILCFLSIVVSGFFTILYSMEWGKEKSNQWLTTFLLSFFQSVIVVQPIKVLLLVAFLACVLKKPELDDDDAKEDLNQILAENDTKERKRDVTSLSQIMLQRQYDKSELQAPDPEQLAKARHDRLMEIKMEAVLKDIAIYTFFLVVIFFLSYQQRDPQSYMLSNHIKNTMLDKHGEIKTVLDYWTWLDETFLPSLYAVSYANEQEIEYWRDTACAADMNNRRIGVARLRQMRVKNDTCTILPQLTAVIHHCRGDYSWTNDDTKDYLPYWVVPPDNITDTLKDSDDPFVYQSSLKLKSAPYVGTLATYKGGGYVILTKRQFCRTKAILDNAKENNWLDLNTRAIFLEYTVYNPNSNLFASVTALTEFLTTGSATSRLDVKVFRLMSYIGGFGVIVLIFEILFGITTLLFFVQCVKKVKNERAAYFKDFWRVLEFVLLCFAIASIVLYALKHVLTKVALRALKNRKSDGFVNFNTVALYDEVYGYLMAAVVFLATVQFLKLLQFNKKMGMLGATVKVAAIDLRNFSITFCLYFTAFTCTAYLLFGNVLESYQNFVTSAESMFAFALGSFEYGELTTAQPFWGPVFIFSYIGLVYICLMNIFLAILGEAFTQVKEDVALQSNDYEVVEFIMKTIKNLFK